MEDQALERLIGILGKETDLLGELHAALAGQQGALQKGDAEGIKKSVEVQIAVLSKISGLERERVALVSMLQSGRDCGGEDLTLTFLIEFAPQHAERLREVRAALADVLKAIGTLNRHNSMLINQSLSYISKTLRMIAGEDTSSTVYTPAGDVTCATGQLAVDRKI